MSRVSSAPRGIAFRIKAEDPDMKPGFHRKTTQVRGTSADYEVGKELALRERTNSVGRNRE